MNRLFGPGRAIWRVDREAALLLGAGRALLLQLAHPLVAAGVAEHSRFTENPLGRLWRTLDTSYTIVFGDREAATAAVRRMDVVHRRVHGVLREATARFPAGTPYDAMDPALRLWVHATLVDTSLLAYGRFVRPLTAIEQAAYYADSREMARVVGIPEPILPPTLDDFRSYVAATLARDVAVGATARALARSIFRPRPAVGLGTVARLLEPVTVGLLPPTVREQYGHRWGRRHQQAFDALARTLRAALPAVPPVLRIVPWARAAERQLRAMVAALPAGWTLRPLHHPGSDQPPRSRERARGYPGPGQAGGAGVRRGGWAECAREATRERAGRPASSPGRRGPASLRSSPGWRPTATDRGARASRRADSPNPGAPRSRSGAARG